MKYEAGVTDIQYPHKPRWSGITVEAESPQKAENQFEDMGFYRNLVVRQVYMVCPHTLEKNFPIDADDYYAHTHCADDGECKRVIIPKNSA